MSTKNDQEYIKECDMVRKSVSSRGRRPGQEEVERMVVLYLQGKAFKAIAKETGRHWQTVRKYTVAALQEREGKEVRQGALKEALAGHFQDLVGALGSLPGLLDMPVARVKEPAQVWRPPSPGRRERLLLQALRDSHAKESPLWSWWDSWNQTREAYEKALTPLRKRIAREMARMGAPPGVSLADGLPPVVLVRGRSIADGFPLYDPDMLQVRLPGDREASVDREELWLGQSTRLAGGEGMDKLRQQLADLMRGMEKWQETKELARLHAQLSELNAEIEEEVEVLSLRRAFPRHCRLCPV
jgi:hypothetical protein